MYLTHPLAKALSDVIQAGTLGEIRSITGRYCAAIAQFVNPDSMGCIYNLGCYPASLMHLLLQQAFGDEIFADYRITGHGRRGADGNICETSAVLQFANGTLAHLHSAEDYGMDWAFSVQGTRGSLNLLSNPWLPEATGNRFAVTLYEQPPQITEVSADADAFVYQVKLVIESINQGLQSVARPAVRPADSRQIMKLLTDWQAATQIG